MPGVIQPVSKWQSQALSLGPCVSEALPLSVRLQLKFVLRLLGFQMACLEEQGAVVYNRFPLREHKVDRCLLWHFNYIWCSPCSLKILEELQSVHQANRGNLGSLREAVHLNVKTHFIQGSIIWSSELKLRIFQFLLSFYWLSSSVVYYVDFL